MFIKKSVSIIILFILLLTSNSTLGMVTGPDIECSDIIYDAEKNLSQISIELHEKGWIISWSKYDIYISKSLGKIKSNEKIQLPSTIGTLAYEEIHYLNCSNVITGDLLNQYVWFKLVKKGDDSEFWARQIKVVSGIIEHDFTIVDDFDSGREIQDWWAPDPVAINICASIYIVTSFILFIAVILIIIKNTRRKQHFEDWS